MERERTVTLVIACLNEAPNIGPTYEGSRKALRTGGFGPGQYEIILVNDGSTDATGEIADDIAASDPAARVVHNPVNMGYGSSFRIGLNQARTTYLVVVPGDDEIEPDSLAEILAAVGFADIITGYPTNTEVRPALRRTLSRGFVVMMNGLFGSQLHYYNGPNVYALHQIRPLEIDTSSFAFNAITVVRLLRRGHSIKQVGMRLRGRASSRTNAVRLKNIAAVLADVGRLLVHRT
jgi:glycosyltransferase involved in cell wall biosynthesis